MNFKLLRRVGLLVLLYVIIAGFFLARQVRNELETLSSATSDNVNWTLTQIEVEFLEFQNILDTRAVPSEETITSLRERFDILYSRLKIISEGEYYKDFRDAPDVTDLLTKISTYLDKTTTLIDSSDAVLSQSIGKLRQMSKDIRYDIRNLVVEGVLFFAERAGAKRESIATTLKRLAVLSAVFVLVVALLTWYSDYATRRARHRQEALVNAYARLNTVMKSSFDAIIVADAQCHVLSFNPAAERMFKYKEREVFGRVLASVIVPKEYRYREGNPKPDQYDPAGIIGKGPLKLTGMRSDGSQFPVEVVFELAKSDGDDLLIGFLRDVSEQLAAEAELVEARDRALIGEKTKGEFLTVMTHEIRTPLNGILGNLSLLEDTKLTDQQQRYIDNMNVSGQLLMQHVDAVLDITRFEAGQLTIVMEPVNLQTLVDDLVNSQLSRASEKGNALLWRETDKSVGWVQTDPRRLQQILLNLLDNAIKYTRRGKILLELDCDDVDTAIGTQTVEFRVIDTGVGIAPGNLERVFEDFQTNDTSFQRVTGGTGLGLGIVRRLVDALGGEVGVESSPGEGSVFWVRLPFQKADAPEQLPRRNVSAQQGQALNLLLVEDNEINLAVAQEMLWNMGHHVTSARNGVEAVELAEKSRFDLIFMDIAMPLLDGKEAAKQIRTGNGPSAKTPIVALSANVLPEAKERFKAAGMTDFLGKPFQKGELRALLRLYATKTHTTDHAARAMRATELADQPQDQMAEVTTSNVSYAPKAVERPSSPTSTTAPTKEDELRERYLSELEEYRDWITEERDSEELAFRSHKVAGSAAVFGDFELQHLLIKLEETARKNASDAELTAQKTRVTDRIGTVIKMHHGTPFRLAK